MKKYCVFLAFICLCLSSLAQTSDDRADILKTKIISKNDQGFKGAFKIEEGDSIVLAGGGNLEFEDRYGWLESRLRKANPKTNFTLRNISWEGDTVFKRLRDVNHGSLLQHLAYLKADIVFLQFGQMEIFQNEGSKKEFVEKFDEMLQQVSTITKKIVVLSPMQMEKSPLANGPDLLSKNTIVKEYAVEARRLAEKYDALFVDLTGFGSRGMTRDGIHLSEKGHEELSGFIARSLKLQETEMAQEALFRKAITEKNHFWREFYRPLNWGFAYGDRTHVTFGQGFNSVAKSYKPLIEAAEKQLLEMGKIGKGKELQLNITPKFKHSELEGLSPEEQLKNMNISDSNLEFNLFASEKDGIVNPVRMKWDRFGRLWVLCIPDYPQPDPGQKPSDYILICEDTDKDGKADKFTKFAENILLPMGIEFDNEGVYVCESTDLVYYKDADHDGKPESKKIILSGFGTGDTHQNINSLNWGHDGTLWFTQGLHAFGSVETVHGVTRMERSGVYRYKPKTGKLETFFGGSRAGQNCWGAKSNKWGETIHVSGATPGIYDASAGAVNITEGPRQPNYFCWTPGRKKCDMEYVESRHFPESMQGQMWTATFYSSQVNVFKTRIENGAWKSEELPAVIPRAHKAFRPLEIKTGPQGAMYILDWYNEIIGHYQASYKDPRRDKSHGRIWRVTYKGRPLSDKESFDKKSVSELVELMGSNEVYKRRVARRILFNLPTSDLLPELNKLSTSEDPLILTSLLGVYQSHEVVNEELLEKVLNHSDPRARAAATIAIGRWAERLQNTEILLLKAAADDNARVRVHAMVAAGYFNNPAVIKVLVKFLEKERNWNHRYSAGIAATKTIDSWLPKFKENYQGMSSEQISFAMGIGLSYRKETTLSLLRELIKDSRVEVRRTAQAELLKVGLFSDYKLVAESLDLNSSKELSEFSKAVRRKSWPAPKNAEEIISAQLKVSKTDALMLAGIWNMTQYKEELMALLNNPKTDSSLVLKILQSSSRILDRTNVSELMKLTEHKSFAVRSQASHVLFNLDQEKGAIAAFKALPENAGKKDILKHLNPFISKQSNAKVLAAFTNGKTLSKEKAQKIYSSLQGAGYNGTELMSALQSVISPKPVSKTSEKFSEEYLKLLSAEVKEKGNSQRGKEVYFKAGMTCVACHKIGESGGALGPALTMVGRALPMERIIESILWPEREVKEGFNSTSLEMKDGSSLQGYLRDETPQEIKLFNPVTNKEQLVEKGVIKKIVRGGTLMPANLLAVLTHQEKLDLFAYVGALGTESKKQKFVKEKASLPKDLSGFKKLFSGKDTEGWNGDMKWFRVEDEAIVAGTLEKKIPHNFFLSYYPKEFYNFELHLDFKYSGKSKINGGIQFRSKRIPNHHEMIGYQADIYEKLSGNIYDESRRKKFVNEILVDDARPILKDNDWNHYVIRCEDNKVQIYLNGYLTADYTEQDSAIAKVKGAIALQVHGGPPVELRYKNLYIKELP